MTNDTPLAVTPADTSTPETSAAPEAAAKVSDPSTEQKPTDAPADKAETVKKPEPTEAEKIKAAMQKRIDKLTAKSTQAERAYQEAMLKLQEKEQSSNGAPKESDFDTVEEFLVAKGKYEAKQEFDKEQKSKAEEAQKRTYAEKIAKKRADFETKEAELRKVTPDYDEKVQIVNELLDDAPKDSPGFEAFREVLFSAPDMPGLIYHLGSNPELAESLLKMGPAEIAWTLIRTAVQLESAPKKTQTPNPEPPKAVSGKTKGEKPLSEMTAEEIDKWRRS